MPGNRFNPANRPAVIPAEYCRGNHARAVCRLSVYWQERVRNPVNLPWNLEKPWSTGAELLLRESPLRFRWTGAAGASHPGGARASRKLGQTAQARPYMLDQKMLRPTGSNSNRARPGTISSAGPAAGSRSTSASHHNIHWRQR